MLLIAFVHQENPTNLQEGLGTIVTLGPIKTRHRTIAKTCAMDQTKNVLECAGRNAGAGTGCAAIVVCTRVVCNTMHVAVMQIPSIYRHIAFFRLFTGLIAKMVIMATQLVCIGESPLLLIEWELPLTRGK